MRVRTVTTGMCLDGIDEDRIGPLADFNQAAKALLEAKGFEVQTTRLSSNNWPQYAGNMKAQSSISSNGVLKQMSALDAVCKRMGVDFFSIGKCSRPEHIRMLPPIISKTSRISCCASMSTDGAVISEPNAIAAAEAIMRISKTTDGGLGNFRFCAEANCPPGIPFFPASYHEGPPSFALGLESADVVYAALRKARSSDSARKELARAMTKAIRPLLPICKRLSRSHRIRFSGIDLSPAPSLEMTGSIAYALEAFNDRFGLPGTLSGVAMVTSVLKGLKLPATGYSGIMLPVCEDLGLCQAADEKRFNLDSLLLYSTVCGCGLDTVPVPGAVRKIALSRRLCDLATLALRHKKPLSARLLPVPGRRAGERTAFRSQYLANCRIFEI